MFDYLDGIKMTQRDLRALAKKLDAVELSGETWFEYRERNSLIPLAYSKNNYGVVAELYFDKVKKQAIYV